MISCKKCGTRIHKNEKFCSKCGRKVHSWGKTNWIILGGLVVLAIIGNVFFEGGSFKGFIIASLLLIAVYLFFWYESDPERVEAKRSKREKEREERERYAQIRREEAERERGRAHGRKMAEEDTKREEERKRLHKHHLKELRRWW